MRRIEIRFAERLALVTLTLGLSACALGGRSPLPGPKPFVSPQVAYRIDDHRYFEITPHASGECTGKMIYFVDTAKSIRSEAVLWDNVMTQAQLIIDATTDQYLVGPVTRGNINCSSGGGGCGGDKMPYSTDGGRTWKRVSAYSSRDGVMVSGSAAYNVNTTGAIYELDLASPQFKDGDWKFIRGFVFSPRIASMDTRVQCKAQGNGSLK